VKAFGDIGQVLEYALDVVHHGITGPGDDSQLLLEKCSAQRHTMALQHFIDRATNAVSMPGSWHVRSSAGRPNQWLRLPDRSIS